MPPGLTELSRRLLAAFDASLYCDLEAEAAVDADEAMVARAASEAAKAAAAQRAPCRTAAEAASGSSAGLVDDAADGAPPPPPAYAGPACTRLGAHRAVLARNPALCLEDGDAPTFIEVSAGSVSKDTLRVVLRAHYMENEHVDGHTGNEQAIEVIRKLKMSLTIEELRAVQATFGQLDPTEWEPLHRSLLASVAGHGRWTDCVLHIHGGSVMRAHRFVLGGAEDGHFFNAALRWPGPMGSNSSEPAVTLPEGLGPEAFSAMLKLRYGLSTPEAEHILEMRHFAELFDWPGVARSCESSLEAMLADPTSLDVESMMAVLSYSEENDRHMPARLKAATLAATVRQWSRMTEMAGSSLTPQRHAELGALQKVQRRDGHVCGSLEEYLHAACDDLTNWERGLASDCPQAAKKQLEHAWTHWHQLLFEYGHIFGAEAAECWRFKVRRRREQFREERAVRKAKLLRLSEGRTWFEPSMEWREVPANAVCPQGLEYRMDMASGLSYARMSL